MPEDLKLTTKRLLTDQLLPFNLNATDEYFGEGSNDIQLNKINDFDTVSGTAKLAQEITKILLTVRGTNTNFPLYGSALQTLVGTKSNFQVIQATVSDEVIGALQVLQFINKENPNPDERPDVLELLKIEQPEIDQILITLSVITASGKKVSSSLTVSI